MPQQEGGHPTRAPHNIPPSSTSGKPSPQPGSVKKASPRDPLKNLANYRSAGWRKDLGHILRSFYHYSYPSHKEEEWKKLRTKSFDYLEQCQEEWRTIKEEKLLEYMPYMERHFHTLTSIRLKGLSQFTGWIKPGSYYHGVVAKKGQLHLCLHLDLRVLEKAKTLWVAVWLHHLDMAAAGNGVASYSLDATRHSRGPLLEFFLVLQASSLTFEEVVHWVLAENWYKVESSLDNVWELQDRLQRELKDLTEAHKVEPTKSSEKKMKRDIEQRQKDLKGLEAIISQYESSLGGAQVQPEGTPASEDNPSDSGAEGAQEMATTLVAEDAPTVSTTHEPLTSPPGEEHTCSMEVDDGDDHQPPASPVSHREDELLTGRDAVGVEGEMANLMVSSPRGYDGGDEGASI